MVGAGTLMILLALVSLYLFLRKRLTTTRWFLWILPFAIGLPYLANACGWLMTEMGRQPWIVFGLMKTSQAVSPTVGWGSVLASLLTFTLLYGLLAVADVFLLVKYAREDASPASEQTHEEEEEIPTLVGIY